MLCYAMLCSHTVRPPSPYHTQQQVLVVGMASFKVTNRSHVADAACSMYTRTRVPRFLTKNLGKLVQTAPSLYEIAFSENNPPRPSFKTDVAVPPTPNHAPITAYRLHDLNSADTASNSTFISFPKPPNNVKLRPSRRTSTRGYTCHVECHTCAVTASDKNLNSSPRPCFSAFAWLTRQR